MANDHQSFADWKRARDKDRSRHDRAQYNAGLNYNEHYLGGMGTYGVELPPWALDPQFKKGHRYRSANGRILDVKARYAVGPNQTVDPQAWAKVIGRSPEEIRDIQIQMVQAGILKPKGFTPMAPDDATKKAFAKLLTEANGAGMRWGDYLTARVQLANEPGGSALGSLGPVKEPLTLQLANPDTVKGDVAGFAPETLGSRAAAGDPQHYVDEIHAQQTKQQTDYYNQTGSGFSGGEGGTTYDPASVKDLMIKEHPVQFGVAQMGPAAQQILSQLEGRGSGIQ